MDEPLSIPPVSDQTIINDQIRQYEEELEIVQNALIESQNEINHLKFFSDQVRFNSIIYEGMNILLRKVTDMESKLNDIGEKLNGKNVQG